jgi:hypothetical protein
MSVRPSLLARELQELAHENCGTVRSLMGLLDIVACRVVLWERLQRETV